MRRTLLVAGRVVRQLFRNPRFLVLSVAAPLVIVYLLKIFFDTLPPTFDVARYAVPVAAFVVHFLAFLLCAISLVQERTMGTMERMFINGEETLVMLFVVVWLLAIASVMLGIFISTFARHEGQVFPFVPLIILPSVFLSGLLVDVDELPTWADWLGHAFPLFWANDVIQDVIESGWTFGDVQGSLAVLVGYSVALLLLASLTLREVE
jgi:ABC-2 type transport system permease protein